MKWFFHWSWGAQTIAQLVAEIKTLADRLEIAAGTHTQRAIEHNNAVQDHVLARDAHTNEADRANRIRARLNDLLS